MKLIKRLGALFVALCLMATMIPAAFAAEAQTTGAITLTIGSPTMSVNGSSTTIDAQGSRATLYQGNTMLPLRSVVENMGGHGQLGRKHPAGYHEVQWLDRHRHLGLQKPHTPTAWPSP